MAENDKDIVAFLRPHAGAFRCPKCRRSLADCRLRQLDRQGPRYTVEVTCRNCELVLLVVLELAAATAVDEEVVSDVGEEVVSDVGEEVLDPISNQELLAVHKALSRHRGPLTALLRHPDDD
ncbi:MAG: hypothetical protein ACREN4_09270 [Candidatus Dormibacteria bacterium]